MASGGIEGARDADVLGMGHFNGSSARDWAFGVVGTVDASIYRTRGANLQ